MGYRRETMNEPPQDFIGEIIDSINSTVPDGRSDLLTFVAEAVPKKTFLPSGLRTETG